TFPSSSVRRGKGSFKSARGFPWESLGSGEIARTWTSLFTSASCSSRKALRLCVALPERSQNSTRTLFVPLEAELLYSFPSWSFRVKSGASLPVFGGPSAAAAGGKKSKENATNLRRMRFIGPILTHSLRNFKKSILRR